MAYNWKSAILSTDANIRDAINVLNNEALRIALVCAEDYTLLGVISDGDIRRSILAGHNLDTNIKIIMNATPCVATPNNTRKEILLMMESKRLLQVPVVAGGKVVGLETLQALTASTKFNNPIFIMAGGFGTRLKPLTDNCPKPLLAVGGKPILESIIERFIEFGFHNFFISTHYMPEKIRDYFKDGSQWNVSIKYIHEEIPLGTGGALGLLPKDIPQLPLIMINGDVLTKVNFQQLIDFHNTQNPAVTVCTSRYEYQIPYGVIESNDYKLEKIVEKPTHQVFINTGIYVVSPSTVKGITSNKRIDMPALLENLISIGEHVATFPLHEYWLDIGQKEDFMKANADYEHI